MIVFVHGVPETASIWDPIRSALDRESVALALPGFGRPRPEGFGATMDDYVDWLLGELAGVDGPIDLVGHDWGALFTYRVATAHGDRLRSWAADIANVVHRGYEWHEVAKRWQAPGEGEAFLESQKTQAPEVRAALFEAMGVPPWGALEMARASDATMAACTLALYRSAVPNPHHHWGPFAPTENAGLVLCPTEDPFSDEALAREVADGLAATFATLDGIGHFWPYQAPERVAATLERFWASLP